MGGRAGDKNKIDGEGGKFRQESPPPSVPKSEAEWGPFYGGGGGKEIAAPLFFGVEGSSRGAEKCILDLPLLFILCASSEKEEERPSKYISACGREAALQNAPAR